MEELGSSWNQEDIPPGGEGLDSAEELRPYEEMGVGRGVRDW